MKIGVFDSGIGGMTVLKELIKTFPLEEYVYFGDTANVPYGSKSSSKIRELCETAAITLKGKKLDCLIVACNTASAIALDIFKEELFPIPVLGVVEPGVQAILEVFRSLDANKDRRILILGTKATIKSQIYSREVRKHIQFSEISEQACPLVVPLLEEGWRDHPLTLEVIREYTKNYASDKVPGVALLACTHYPWAHNVFQSALPGWKLIDSSKAVAKFIELQNLDSHKKFKIEWIFTDADGVATMALDEIKAIRN